MTLIRSTSVDLKAIESGDEELLTFILSFPWSSDFFFKHQPVHLISGEDTNGEGGPRNLIWPYKGSKTLSSFKKYLWKIVKPVTTK